MKQQKTTPKKNPRPHRSDGLSITDQNLTAHGGLPLALHVLKALEFKPLADDFLGLRGSNRGYRHGDILTALVVMLIKGGRSLSDVKHLHNERQLLKRLGIKKIPGVNTLSRWLRHHGHDGVPLINQLNQKVLAVTLARKQVTEVTLDLDVTVIATDKASATPTYQKQRGVTMMVGTLAEVNQVIAVELRPGNMSPSTDNVGFIAACQELLPSGVRLKQVRIDAAGYQHQVIDYPMRQGIEFVIRAAMNPSIAQDIGALSPPAWQPLRLHNGRLSTRQEVARCQHTMYRSKRVFDLVVQRTRRAKRRPPGQRTLLELFIANMDWYDHRAIATNINALDEAEIVYQYNQRGEHSENRIKELKSDFAGGRLPCSEFAANAFYVAVCMLAFNVFALMRHGLPAWFGRMRAPTLRQRVLGLAGKLVQHSHQWQLKLCEVDFRLVTRLLASLRDYLGDILPKMHSPLLE